MEKKKKSLLNKITPDEALEILTRLAKKNPRILKDIEKEAEQLLKKIDFQEIVDEVYAVLNGLDVEELWERSGSHRDGYSSPEDQAVEMMEEALEPYNEEVIRYLDLGMHKEAEIYCMGVLKGIYRYDQESKSDSTNWFVDIPAECSGYLLDVWKQKTTDRCDLEEMDHFIKTECGRWSDWALRK
ncbi:MAG: hypothetical protein D4R67_07170 [Bacteroidetes bacterium]|nr:MAG: hypothetical protein D4R67_07170 [Bacteroidota bacterium]